MPAAAGSRRTLSQSGLCGTSVAVVGRQKSNVLDIVDSRQPLENGSMNLCAYPLYL